MTVMATRRTPNRAASCAPGTAPSARRSGTVLPLTLLLAALLTIAAPCAAQVEPAPLRARPLFEAIESAAPGILTLDDWTVLERHLESADAAWAARVRPAADAMIGEAGLQVWLNWPALKPARLRHARDRLVDDQMDIDRTFFAAARTELLASDRPSSERAHPTPVVGRAALLDALERFASARRRALLPPPGLLGARPTDLRRIAETTIDRASLGGESAADREALLIEWEAAFEELASADAALRRAVADEFERWLADNGYDLGDPPSPQEPWLGLAFDWWESRDDDLTASARSLLALNDRVVDRVAALLSPDMACRWRMAVMRTTAHIAASEDPSLADDEFARALRLRDLDPDRRIAIEAARQRWRTQDAALCTTSLREHHAMATAWCPLTHEHYGPDDRYGRLREHFAALTAERLRLSTAALASLQGIVGPDFGVVATAPPGDDPRLLPIAPAAAIPAQPPELPWTPRSAATCLLPRPQHAGWLDRGTLDAPTAQGIAAWFGLDDTAREAWLSAHRDLATSLAKLLPVDANGAPLPTWGFDDRYRHDGAAATRWLEASVARLELLLKGEGDLWTLAEALCEVRSAELAQDPGRPRRIRLMAEARESAVLLHSIDRWCSRWRWEHAGELSLCAAAVEALATAGPAPSTQSDAVEALLAEHSAGLVELCRRRSAALRPLVVNLAALEDAMMWSGGQRGATMKVEQRRMIEELDVLDAPHRTAFIEAQRALAEALEQLERGDASPAGGDGSLATTIVESWLAAAYPNVHAADPPARTLLPAELRQTRASGTDGAPIAALIDWHATRDAALAAEGCALCDEAGLKAYFEPESNLARHRQSEAIARARTEVSDRALCRARLLRRGG